MTATALTRDEKIARIAADVMGWTVFPITRTDDLAIFPRLVQQVSLAWWLISRDGYRRWEPFKSVNDAMEVSEKCGRFDMIAVDDGWMVGDGSSGFSDATGVIEMRLSPFAIAKTLPEAICECALLTLDRGAQ